MLTIENWRKLDPISEELLASLEEQNGIKLPPNYRQFLLKHNGGAPNLTEFQYYKLDRTTPEGSSLVGEFSYFGEAKYFCVPLTTFGRLFSPRLFPIAVDQGGNLLAISCNSRDVGVIYYCEREYLREGVEPFENAIFFVAETFEAFLESLQDS